MNDPRSANLYATINFTEGDVKIKSNRIRLNFAQGYSTFVKEIEYAARQCPTDDGFSVEKVVIAFGEEYFVLTPEFDKNVMLGKLLHTNKDKLKITIEVVPIIVTEIFATSFFIHSFLHLQCSLGNWIDCKAKRAPTEKQ